MGAFLNSRIRKMAQYEVSFEELRKYSSTVEVEADTPEEAIKIAYLEIAMDSFFEMDSDYENVSPLYTAKIENTTDDVSYSMRDAISNKVETVASDIEVRGLENMKEGHLNSFFEKEKMKMIKIDLPELDGGRL